MTPRARHVVTFASVSLLAFLPIVAIYIVFLNVARGGAVTDLENVFYGAAEVVSGGGNPYSPLDDPVIAAGKAYVYPPLIALAGIPLTALGVEAAGFVVMGLLVLGVFGTLLVLGIRDWRCYGIALLWPPVLSAIQTGNITIPLALGAAIVWRCRDQARAAGASLGLTLAAKLILWPLALWLAATRRFSTVVYALGVGCAAVVVSWAVIGFAGLVDYPALLRRLQEIEESQGYTVYALALDLGASSSVARALWIALAVSLLLGVVVLGRRGDDRRAFVLAVGAALACSPIVWLHYFALLLVAVAVAEPRLGPAWFVPLLMYMSTGTHNGTTFQTAATVASAAFTIAVALRFTRTPLPAMRLDGTGAVRLRGSP